MSKDHIVAKRYARALFMAAQEKGQLEEVERELTDVVENVYELDDFRKIIEHPGIDMGAKLSLIQSALEGQVSDLVYHTIKLIVNRHRFVFLPALVQYYTEMANDALGRVKAIVSTPQALSDAEVDKLKEVFSGLTGRNVVIEQIVDPNILGGLRVRIGNRLYDGSLSTRLAELQKSLAM